MKRTIALILAVAMALALVPATALAADPHIVASVSSADFSVGDTVGKADITVTYYDSVGNDAPVTDFTINGGDSVQLTAAGKKTLQIAYQHPTDGKLTTTVSIDVKATVDGLTASLSDKGKARVFVQGDTISAEDFVVQSCTAGSAEVITLTAGQYSISPTTLKAGDNVITFTASGKKATLTLPNVAPKSDPKLIVTGSCKTEYGLGEVFDPAGLTFTFQPRNSTTAEQVDVTGSVTWTPNTPFSEKGDKTITFSYTDSATGDTVTATMAIKIIGMVKTFELTGSLEKGFYAGDVFDPMGLTATIYDYAGNVIVTHKFGIDADDGDFAYSKTPLKNGQTSIDITYTHQATGETIKRSVDINVSAKLNKLEKTAGDIRTYYVGESFDPSGLTFTLTYNRKDNLGQNETETITGSTAAAYDRLTYAKGPFTTVGAYTLPVSYTDSVTGETVTCNLIVDVRDAKAAKLEAATVQADLQVVVGDDFEPDKLFEVMYQAPNTTGFNKLSFEKGEYTISPNPASFTEAGAQTFTISKGDVSATVVVTVLPVIKQMTVTGVGSLKFYGGDAFEPGDPMVVTIYFNRGTLWPTDREPAVLDHNMMDPYEGLSWPTAKLVAGQKTLTLTYTDSQTGATATKDITVTVNPFLKEMTIDATGLTLYADDVLNLDDAEITIASNKSTVALYDGKIGALPSTTGVISYDRSALKAGANQMVTVTFTHADSGESITADAIFSVSKTTYTSTDFVAGALKKTEYTAGEMFDPSGIAWKVKKNGTEDLTITSGFKCYPDRPLTEGDTSVTVVYGNLAKVYEITVNPRTLVSIKVTQNPDAASFYVGQTFDPTGMIVTATYNNKTTSQVAGYTYDTTVFTEADIGKKVITITYKEGAMIATTTLEMPIVAAPIRAASLVLSQAALSTIESKTTTLTATVYPTNATNKSLVWTSSDTSVARVDQAGVVTAVGKGACVITATTTDGSNRYADCYVTVAPKVPVKTLTLKSTTMELLVGDSTILTATIAPENATYTEATWTTSDENIVSVDKDGKITGVKLGSATITASADGVAASMTIKVVSTLTKYGTVVNCSRRVNVRSAADGNSKAIGYAYLGTTYTILGESGNWYKIQFSATQTGYIWKDYLKESDKGYTSVSDGSTTPTTPTTPSTPTTPTSPTPPSTTVYTTLTVTNCQRYCYVRKGPSTATSKAGHAKPGETYKLLGLSGDWYLIDYNGAQAYIYKVFGKLS